MNPPATGIPQPLRLRAELGLGLVLTFLAGFLHLQFLLHAGGLWRDEVVSLNIATLPSWPEMFGRLPFDSFPGFFHLLLHLWSQAGLASTDMGVRTLGALIGLGLLAAFWFAHRSFGGRAPLLSLLLVGLSPLAIRTTDNIRAYGIGTVLIILTLALVWKVVRAPSFRNTTAAAFAAILSVQSLYQNSFFLLAICLGGMAVAFRHRHWRLIGILIGIGLLSALSLLFYVKTMQQMGEFKQLFAGGLTWSRMLAVFSGTLGDQGVFMVFLWLGLALAGVFAALRLQLSPAGSTVPGGARDLALFLLVVFATSLGGFMAWLKILDFPTQSWYYIPLLALALVALEGILETLPPVFPWNWWRHALVFPLVLFCFFTAVPGVRIRQTNIDLVASGLKSVVGPDDLILVAPWYCGTTFNRYYNAQAVWSTVPPLADTTLQQYDLLKKQMLADRPLDPLLQKITVTLRSGNRLWLVGGLPFRPDGLRPPELSPAPDPRWGWDHDAYTGIWEMQVAWFVQSHARTAEPVPIPGPGAVNPFENLPVVVVEGWKD